MSFIFSFIVLKEAKVESLCDSIASSTHCTTKTNHKSYNFVGLNFFCAKICASICEVIILGNKLTSLRTENLGTNEVYECLRIIYYRLCSLVGHSQLYLSSFVYMLNITLIIEMCHKIKKITTD